MVDADAVAMEEIDKQITEAGGKNAHVWIDRGLGQLRPILERHPEKYLISWRSGGSGRRFVVSFVDEEEDAGMMGQGGGMMGQGGGMMCQGGGMMGQADMMGQGGGMMGQGGGMMGQGGGMMGQGGGMMGQSGGMMGQGGGMMGQGGGMMGQSGGMMGQGGGMMGQGMMGQGGGMMGQGGGMMGQGGGMMCQGGGMSYAAHRWDVEAGLEEEEWAERAREGGRSTLYRVEVEPRARTRSPVPGGRQEGLLRRLAETAPWSLSSLPARAPDIWEDGPKAEEGGKVVWTQSDHDITEQLLLWLKGLHTVEWGAEGRHASRPDWAKGSSTHWWCLACRAQFPSIVSVAGHCVGKDHWPRRKRFEMQWQRQQRRSRSPVRRSEPRSAREMADPQSRRRPRSRGRSRSSRRLAAERGGGGSSSSWSGRLRDPQLWSEEDGAWMFIGGVWTWRKL